MLTNSYTISTQKLYNIVFAVLIFTSTTYLLPAFYAGIFSVLYFFTGFLLTGRIKLNEIDKLFLYSLIPVFIFYITTLFIKGDAIIAEDTGNIIKAVYNLLPSFFF